MLHKPDQPQSPYFNSTMSNLKFSTDNAAASLNRKPDLSQKLTVSLYDNLNEIINSNSSSARDLNEIGSDENTEILNDIIAQVMRVQSQSEQLDRIDHVNVDWENFDLQNQADLQNPESPSIINEKKDQSEMKITNSNFIIIHDIVLPKKRDSDTSKIDINLTEVLSSTAAVSEPEFNRNSLLSNVVNIENKGIILLNKKNLVCFIYPNQQINSLSSILR